ncbi:PREDICTED: cAMP-responsive element modulator isoform X3 [Ficedula albicollis]|uniref:cAMP-responsive element modulator isoform X3 n=1 Tax=Ficedula albicollis TaxID=59894 RepID=UPI000359B48C|nr:PREDICTED: cAMP-responsive element modulator isoform X3 [Ficedula albicollis]
MTKCAKKYRKGAVRLMTMEMVEQDDNAVDSMTERSAGHLQNQPGQSQISSGSEVSVAASSAGRGSPAVTLVQLPSGQTVHVQGVIQATQPSVIQSPHMQAVQVASIADEAAQSEVIIDSQKRREILSRRPSYRKILNELSSDSPAIAKIEEEEKSEDEGTPSVTISQGGTIQTVTNSGAPQPGATIVQYAAQSSDGTQQFFVPGSPVVVQAATGDMPAYQIRTPTTTLPQGVVMAASPGTLHSPQQMAEEATRKRELRLLKNREAAKECRRRKKEYIKCLESRVAVLEVQNKKLIQELETLKDICSSKTD